LEGSVKAVTNAKVDPLTTMHGGGGDGDGIAEFSVVGGDGCDENSDWAMVGPWKNSIGCHFKDNIQTFMTKND
jgi:hypothetical protein